MLPSTIHLNTGTQIPRLGLGVYQAERGAETHDAVREALRVGYRHIDTARAYGNERDVGAAVRESGIPREDIFVATKLWNSDQGYDSALRAFDASFERLDLQYVDLYLVHWPVKGKRLDSWRAMEQILESGRAKAVGVSNYMVHHLEELLSRSKVVPAVNQIEISPFLQHREVRAFCAARGIIVEAYSPLTRGHKLGHPAVVAVAKRVGRTPAQVLIRWGLQHDLVSLPKSVRAERIAENAQVFDFELSVEDMKALDALEAGLATGWDPRGEP
jgi:diketogulonate reductase-like aldo/keto reductase